MLAGVVGLAGAVGAVARFTADRAVEARLGGAFPFGTFVVNVAGSLLLGLAAGLALEHGLDPDIRTVLGAGFCGGLTTWSTASWETVRLAEEGLGRLAVANAVGGLVASLLAAGAGLAVTGAL